MPKTEADVYQRFKRVLEPLKAHVHRIENAIQSGTFDVAISRSNRTLWVELKRDSSQQLRPSQIRWAMDRYQAGCVSDMWVVTANKNDWYIFDIVRVIIALGVLPKDSATSAADQELRNFFIRRLYG
jgi:hypothetical protein